MCVSVVRSTDFQYEAKAGWGDGSLLEAVLEVNPHGKGAICKICQVIHFHSLGPRAQRQWEEEVL